MPYVPRGFSTLGVGAATGVLIATLPLGMKGRETLAGFTDIDSRTLASVTHHDDIPSVLLAEGVNRWRLLAEWDAAPEGSASSVEPPGASGDTARPNYVGPSGNGLVERMKAGAKNPAG